VKRGLSDQKELYLAPLKPSNLKWDALLIIGTGALVATDRQTTRALPTSHLDLFRNMTNISLGGTSATLVGLWAYGIKTKDEHAKETGELELETLANTFLIYTPMQFIAGRERPEEGTGNGRFWRHGGFNTSFPAGHPMFTWAMATVVAHEYPRPWVKLLAYGAATSVSAGRFLGREHFASDVVVGSALGYLIATHIFHARCDPERSDACHRQIRKQPQP
jgi:membrane-associated phospholipid phosphatase